MDKTRIAPDATYIESERRIIYPDTTNIIGLSEEKQNGTLVWVDKMGNLKSSECEVVTTIIHGGIYGNEVDEKYYVYGSEVPEKRIIKFVEND